MEEGFISLRQSPAPAAAGDVADIRPFGDALLVARAARQDRKAWAQLYQNYYPEVYRRLRFLTGRVSIAEELSQECFVQAMLNIGKLRDRSKFPKWLSGIALNLARKHWRRSQNGAHAYDGLRRVREISANKPGVEEQLADHHRICAIYRQLEQVPEHLREVFILRDIEGVSAREIAELLDISPNNVAVRATRARAFVRDALGARGWLEREGGHGKRH